MTSTVSKPVIGIFLLLQLIDVHGQIQKGTLLQGKKVAAEITAGAKHQYTVNLEKNQYAIFRLMQKGTDLVITTFNPDGSKREVFDSPNGQNGPEIFTLRSDAKARYLIEISPISDDEPPGAYDLEITSVRPAATTAAGRVDEIFGSLYNKETPGVSVAVIKNDSIIFTKGYGMANLEYDIANSPSTVFHIASVSKQFTVFSILLLEKEGKLSLDDDIRKYIPEVPDFGKKITLRHLASHTSGLRDQWDLLVTAGWRMDDVITKEHIMKMVSRQKELNFSPGDEFLYCNTGFTLLAEVVARVSGKSFAEFTRERIFGPLKMNHTLFYDDHEKIVKNRAYSYHPEGNGYKKSVLSFANVGATSLFTTAADLALWATNFWEMRIGDAAIFEKMNTPAKLNSGKPFGGALGQFVDKYKGLKEIQHGGVDAGYRSFLTRFPDEKLAVVVLSNDAGFKSDVMAHKIVDIYLEDKIAKERLTAEKSSGKAQGTIEVGTDVLLTYVGEYELQPGIVVTFTEEDGRLMARVTGQPIVTLIPASTTEFKVEGVEARVEFMPNDGAPVQTIKLYQNGQTLVCKRVEGFDPASVVLTEFTGNYYSDELATTYEFVIVENKLVAKHQRVSDFSLHPVKTDLFSADAWFFGQVRFERGEDKAITGFRISDGRVRNLYFKKID